MENLRGAHLKYKLCVGVESLCLVPLAGSPDNKYLKKLSIKNTPVNDKELK
jgi:hypothetical protein